MRFSYDHILPIYPRLPIEVVRGEGVWLFDTEGNRYLDAIAGLGVNALGHNHPAVVKAIQEQASRVIHTGNGVLIPEQAEAANLLCRLSRMDKVFFCNSGGEANETALKLARLYGHQRGIENPMIIVCEGAFHGRTLATLTASSSRSIQMGFEPLMPGFIRVPFNDIAAVQALAKTRTDIVAILVEPILGSGGIVVPDPDYLTHLRTISHAHHWLLMLDEIQTGVGRTGALYTYQHTKVQPDVVTSAKALANGIPLGACLTHGPANAVFRYGNHGSTFGGNPFACHVAHTVLSILSEPTFIERVATTGMRLMDALKAMAKSYPSIQAVRGQGLMIGIEFSKPCAILRDLGTQYGLFLNVTAQTVLRLLPPLILSDAEMEYFLEQLEKVFERFEQPQ
jgi:acetylornithine/N-succinyldiaminopimelate aminotransferase